MERISNKLKVAFFFGRRDICHECRLPASSPTLSTFFMVDGTVINLVNLNTGLHPLQSADTDKYILQIHLVLFTVDLNSKPYYVLQDEPTCCITKGPILSRIYVH